MSALDAFIVKTHAELARLVAEAKSARRSVDHRPCPDAGACRHCCLIRLRHLSIDDHLDQLEGRDAEPVVAAPPARECGICGRVRFKNFRGAAICMACDGPPKTGDIWSSMLTEDAE